MLGLSPPSVYTASQGGLSLQVVDSESCRAIHRVGIVKKKMKTTENTEFTENNYPFSEITNQAQILSYLKASKKKIGLLINFAKTKIDIKRVIL